MTDDPDLRIASSILDYIFRRLAVDYLSYEERAELNILTTGERTQPTLPGVEETNTETRQGSDIQADPPSFDASSLLLADPDVPEELPPDMRNDPTEPVRPRPATPAPNHYDAPYCMPRGGQLQPAGDRHD